MLTTNSWPVTVPSQEQQSDRASTQLHSDHGMPEITLWSGRGRHERLFATRGLAPCWNTSEYPRISESRHTLPLRRTASTGIRMRGKLGSDHALAAQRAILFLRVML